MERMCGGGVNIQGGCPTLVVAGTGHAGEHVAATVAHCSVSIA